MKKLLILIVISIYFTGCKSSDGSSEAAGEPVNPLPETIAQEFDGSDCVLKESPASTNRLIVFGEGLADQDDGFAFRLANALGKDFSNHAVAGSTLPCQLYNIRNANLTSTDTVVFIIGQNDARLGMNWQEFHEEIKIVRNVLDSKEVDQIVIGTTMRMLPSEYDNHAPFNQGSTPLIAKYRDSIQEIFDATWHDVVDLTMLYQPDVSFYSDGITLNESGKEEVFNLIYDNVNWN